MSVQPAEPLYGVYELVDVSGRTYKVGQSADLRSRQKDYLTDHETEALEFVVLAVTNDRNAMFGLEHGYTNLRGHEGHPLTGVHRQVLSDDNPVKPRDMEHALAHAAAEGVHLRSVPADGGVGPADTVITVLSPAIERQLREPPPKRALHRQDRDHDAERERSRRPAK